MNAIDNLRKYQEKINNLEYTIRLLDWELKIVAPEGSSEDMINLIGEYETKLFKLKASPKYGKLINEAINCEEFRALDLPEQRCIKGLLKTYEEARKVPASFYTQYAKAQNKTNIIWRKAKEENNYALFKPYLKKLIDYTKKYYRYIAPDTENIYDVMLDQYERGMSTKIIDPLFEELKKALIPLIKKVANKNNIKFEQENTSLELMETAKYLLNYIGFDLNRGTLGIYPHGFTDKMGNNDVRIAFNHGNKPNDFVSTIIHEGGHGILEQTIPYNLYLYDNGNIEDLIGLHESQSRFFENILGRNKNFWIPIYDDIKKILHLNLGVDEFVKSLNNPKTSLIRTEADELTYCMHIIVRYEIEKDLFAGKIEVDDLPQLWNAKMKEYLGVTVENDAEGLMQDVHWSEGEFGYFPSYLLGSIYDGMFKEAIEKELGNIDELLKQGNIKKITEYLQNNIYINGGAYTSLEIIHKLCHKELSVKPLIKYFQDKYEI